MPTPHLLDPRFPARSRLGAYRGIDHLGALRVLSGVFDIAPFDRPVPLWPCGRSLGVRLSSFCRRATSPPPEPGLRTELIESASALTHAPVPFLLHRGSPRNEAPH